MPGGKSEAGRTEWKIEVIFPVERDITTVASVNRPSTTARLEASTVMDCRVLESCFREWFGRNAPESKELLIVIMDIRGLGTCQRR